MLQERMGLEIGFLGDTSGVVGTGGCMLEALAFSYENDSSDLVLRCEQEGFGFCKCAGNEAGVLRCDLGMFELSGAVLVWVSGWRHGLCSTCVSARTCKGVAVCGAGIPCGLHA
jgi:hypothetical protein